jgi:hypothetical protein
MKPQKNTEHPAFRRYRRACVTDLAHAVSRYFPLLQGAGKGPPGRQEHTEMREFAFAHVFHRNTPCYAKFG